MTLALPTGVFTISLDFELIWGTRDYGGTELFRRQCELERSVIIDRLLELFVRYGISATWCIVGHLFLDRCSTVGGRKHADALPDQPHPELASWFDDDPASTEADAPIFYGRSIVEKIRRCSVPQEIGSHSFAHMIFDAPYASREAAVRDVAKCVETAAEQGLRLRSFVYPRNSVGHTDVLRDHGFTSYRGPEPQWYETPLLPRAIRRLAHLGSVIAASTPPVVMPVDDGGIWNIPGSAILLPMHGVRRYIPASRRSARAIKGIDRAARERRIFHLWFHPTNLADEMDRMFGALEAILKHVAALRDEGVVAVRTMEQLAAAASAASTSKAPAG